jgi:hypothetical protein
MAIPPLVSETVNCHFDEASHYVMLTYSGDVPATGPAMFFEYLFKVIQDVGVDAVHGTIIDMHNLTNFPVFTLNSGVRNSKAANQDEKMTLIPVVCVVKTLYQEEVAKMFTKLAPHKDRRDIVKSVEDAVKFIETWHHKHPTTPDSGTSST